MDYLIKFLAQILQWLLNFLKWGAEWVWSELLGALIGVLNLIPVPQWLSDAPSVVGALPGGVAWGMRAFLVPQGLAIILGAYVIRFIIRRIPLVG